MNKKEKLKTFKKYIIFTWIKKKWLKDSVENVCIILIFRIQIIFALFTGTVGYVDCTSAEGVKPPTPVVTCWQWAATLKALGRDLGSWAVIDLVTVVNGLQHTTLGLTWSDRQSDRPEPINQLVLLCPSTCMFLFSRMYYSICICGTIPNYFKCQKAWAAGQLYWEQRSFNHC